MKPYLLLVSSVHDQKLYFTNSVFSGRIVNEFGNLLVIGLLPRNNTNGDDQILIKTLTAAEGDKDCYHLLYIF